MQDILLYSFYLALRKTAVMACLFVYNNEQFRNLSGKKKYLSIAYHKVQKALKLNKLF